MCWPQVAGLFNVKPYARIYLSPHLDDAVLSCGGRIWQQVQAGERVLVITAFAGDPSPGISLSPFARELHVRWGSPVDAVARRRDEDLTALAYLGAEVAHWPYPDCIYRRGPYGRFLYVGEEALWGEVHPADGKLIEGLTSRLAALPVKQGGEAYAPLGVGHHVDHQILRRAADALRRIRVGQALTYYEDFPYAEDPQAVQAALAGTKAEIGLVMLSEEALAAKIAAIMCYRSQISTFWAGADHVAARVRAFARRTGDGEAAIADVDRASGRSCVRASGAERYWKLTLTSRG